MEFESHLTDSVDLALAKNRKNMEIDRREKLQQSYGSTLCEEKEEDGIKFTVFQMSRTLNCALKELTAVPDFISNFYGDWLVRLDLSFNNLLSISGIDKCKTLEELILNCNSISDEGFCFSETMPNLTCLFLNNNNLTDLHHFLQQSHDHLPNLSLLSLHGNPICQDSLLAFREDQDDDYDRYRLTVLHKLQSLKFLDSRPVTPKEMEEANKRGNFLTKIARPTGEVERSGSDSSANRKKNAALRPLPETKLSQNSKTRNAVAAPTKYHYKGHHSEGNRFITDGHL